jgi:hypothetical protein
MFQRRPRRVPVRALGFHPPLFALNAELEWVLQRAFSTRVWSPTLSVDAKTAVEAALRLDMAGRIAARHPRMQLEEELGAEAAQRLREQYVGVVAREALLEHALQQLLEQAHASGVSCILLKYAALSRMGVLRVGARSASDIDVLVPRASARQFQAALVQNGYREVGLPESAHQLPALQDPNGMLIELHVHLPGISLGSGQPYASADDLISAGSTRQSGNALLPEPAIVAAHAIVHGLVQHACAPHMYSPLKTFADLVDLARTEHESLAKAGDFLKTAMTEEDVASALQLAQALQRGDIVTARAGAPGVLLRHALASQLNAGYALQLRLRTLTRRGTTPLHVSPERLLRALREVWIWARSQTSFGKRA